MISLQKHKHQTKEVSESWGMGPLVPPNEAQDKYKSLFFAASSAAWRRKVTGAAREFVGILGCWNGLVYVCLLSNNDGS